MPKPITIRQATAADHKEIVAIAKQTKYTKHYSNMIFSSEECYLAGRIRVALVKGIITGFTCFRRRTRNPATVLYIIGVSKDSRRGKIGETLINDLKRLSPDVPIELNVMKDNPAAHFFRKQGFVEVGETYKEQAWIMRTKEKPRG